METKEYNVWDYMKTIAILLVVLGHVTRMHTVQGVLDIGIHPTIHRLLTSFIYSFHMPAFFAVSGAVYYINKVERCKYGKQSSFVANKARRLMIPYVIFSLFWVFPAMWYLGFVDRPILYIAESYLLALNPRHLWFLIVLFEIFLLINLIHKKVFKHRWITLCILLISCFIADIMPVAFQLSNLFRYALYFYVGYMFVPYVKVMDASLMGNKKWVLLICVCSIWCCAHLVAYYFRDISFVFNVLNLISALSGTLMLYIACRLWGGYLFKFRTVQSLADNSFGIYLFHPMIIYLLFYHTQKWWSEPYMLSVAVFVIALVSSSILTKLIRWSKLGFVIGEK